MYYEKACKHCIWHDEYKTAYELPIVEEKEVV